MKTPGIVSRILIRRGFKRLVGLLEKNGGEKWDAHRTIDFLFSQDGELIKPWQFQEEMEQLASELEALRPKIVLEIGTANGGTLFMASRLAADDALLISIDLPQGPYGGGYPEWKIPVYKSFARKQQRIELIRADSHLSETFEQISKILNGRTVDYLFIDGDHTYEGSKKDFLMYSRFISPDGFIVFHDIVVHPDETTNVYKLWNELREQYAHTEYVKDWNQKCFGIGILKIKG